MKKILSILKTYDSEPTEIYCALQGFLASALAFGSNVGGIWPVWFMVLYGVSVVLSAPQLIATYKGHLLARHYTNLACGVIHLAVAMTAQQVDDPMSMLATGGYLGLAIMNFGCSYRTKYEIWLKH